MPNKEALRKQIHCTRNNNTTSQPQSLQEINIPANTELYVGRIGSQPNFGLMNNSGFQYQAIKRLPESSFINTRPILEQELDLGMIYR